MKVVYILAGVCIANVVADIIAIKKINDLAGIVKSMKKERIDDWFDSASDILTSHQESIDDLEEDAIGWHGIAMSAGEDIKRLTDDIITLDDGIRRNTRRIKEIQEILGDKMGVIFKDEETEEAEEESDETDN